MQENKKDLDQDEVLAKDSEPDTENTETVEDEADSDDDAVKAFSYDSDDGEDEDIEAKKKPKKSGMVKKQIIMISVFAAVALILTLVYFIVLRPIFNEKTAEVEPI